jgi:hypothetical protein
MTEGLNVRKILRVVTAINGLFFLIFFIYRSLNSTLLADDFHFLDLAEKMGAWNGMLFQYNTYSGRWSAHLAGCLLLLYSHFKMFFILFHLFSLTALYFGIFSVIKSFLSDKVQRNDCHILAICFLISFYVATTDKWQSWFWFISVVSYLWSLISSFFLFFLIYNKRNNILYSFLLIIPSLYIGGASESFALISLFLLIIILIHNYKFSHDRQKRRKIYIALAFLLLSLIISLTAPGTEVRMELLPHLSLVSKFLILCKEIIKVFVFQVMPSIPVVLLMSIPFALLQINTVKPVKYTKVLLASFFCYVLLLSPTVFIMSEAGPARALLLISLLTVITISMILILNVAIRISEKVKSAAVLIYAISPIVLILYLANTL